MVQLMYFNEIASPSHGMVWIELDKRDTVLTVLEKVWSAEPDAFKRKWPDINRNWLDLVHLVHLLKHSFIGVLLNCSRLSQWRRHLSRMGA